MSTTSLNANFTFSTDEILEQSDFIGSITEDGRKLTLNQSTTTLALDESTTPALQSPPIQDLVILGATPTILNLQAAPIGIGRTVDLVGLRIIGWRFTTLAANTGSILIRPATTNGYPLFGPAGQLTMQPGSDLMSVVKDVAASMDAVAVSLRDVEISGTENDTLQYALLFGN